MHSILNIKTLLIEAEALNPITDYKEFITGIFWPSHFKCVSFCHLSVTFGASYNPDATHQLTLSHSQQKLI